MDTSSRCYLLESQMRRPLLAVFENLPLASAISLRQCCKYLYQLIFSKDDTVFGILLDLWNVQLDQLKKISSSKLEASVQLSRLFRNTPFTIVFTDQTLTSYPGQSHEFPKGIMSHKEMWWCKDENNVKCIMWDDQNRQVKQLASFKMRCDYVTYHGMWLLENTDSMKQMISCMVHTAMTAR